MLSDFLVRLGKINEEQIQLERKDSKTMIHINGRKGSGSATIGMINGQPAVALSGAKDVNQVGMTADEKHASVGIIRKGKTVWQAEGEKRNGRGKKVAHG